MGFFDFPNRRKAAVVSADRGCLDNGVVWQHKTHPRRQRLALVVTASGTVEIRTPVGITTRQAVTFLEAHANWAKQKCSERCQAASHDTIRLFAEDVELKRVEGPVTVSAGTISAPSDADLERFLRGQLEQVIAERWQVWLPIIADWDVPQPTWSLRKMSSRWGSCSADGRIRFSTLLVHHAIEQIDYVIVHELCHLKEMNHSLAYWQLVERSMPDWRQRRARLANR